MTGAPDPYLLASESFMTMPQQPPYATGSALGDGPPASLPYLSQAHMEAHVANGQAQPLLDVPFGPVRFAGKWWVVPKNQPEQYLPVEDPHVVSVLDGAQRRIAKGVASG